MAQRVQLGVACLTCGTVALVSLTITPLPAPRSEVRVRVVPDPDDVVMATLFQDQHAGPFRPVRQ